MRTRLFGSASSCMNDTRDELADFLQVRSVQPWQSLLLPLIMKGVASSAELLTGLARAKHIGSILAVESREGDAQSQGGRDGAKLESARSQASGRGPTSDRLPPPAPEDSS